MAEPNQRLWVNEYVSLMRKGETAVSGDNLVKVQSEATPYRAIKARPRAKMGETKSMGHAAPGEQQTCPKERK